MSNASFLKGACSECNGKIEFPAEGRGQKISCPHCGLKTVLVEVGANRPAPAAELSAPARKGPPSGILVLAALVLLAGAIGLAYWLKPKGEGSEQAGSSGASTPKVSAAQSNSVPKAADSKGSNTTPAVKTPATPKSLADLKVGSISLEKTKGSSLIYAVGILQNDSEHQRFGVTIELGLMNDQGKQVGAAKDYVPVIEPHQEWRFRVLVTDPKTVTATLASLKED